MIKNVLRTFGGITNGIISQVESEGILSSTADEYRSIITENSVHFDAES